MSFSGVVSQKRGEEGAGFTADGGISLVLRVGEVYLTPWVRPFHPLGLSVSPRRRLTNPGLVFSCLRSGFWARDAELAHILPGPAW